MDTENLLKLLNEMNNAAARPKDIDDLKYLLKLKERKTSNSKEE